MRTYRGIKVQFHAFLTSALDGDEWLASRTGHFTPGERVPGTLWIGACVGPRAGLHEATKRSNVPSLLLPGVETPVVQPVA